MYIIRNENLDELKEGKTIKYLATIVGYTRPHLTNIFNGKILIDEKTIRKILIPIFKESLKLNEKYEKYGIETMIKHFFKKIK